MTKLLLAAAAAGAALLGAAGQAAAQPGYLPAPAYAYGPYDYAGAERGSARHGFTLAGVRAGVTVLGIDLDAHAGLDIGVHNPSYGYAPAYAPPPPPAPMYGGGYAPQPGYAEPAYGPPPPAPYGYGYAPACGQPCGCGGW